MKCYKCGVDKNFWSEMTRVTLYKDKDGKPVKKDVCYVCLGWTKK